MLMNSFDTGAAPIATEAPERENAILGGAEVGVLIVGFRNPEDVVTCLAALAEAESSPSFSVLICENGGEAAYDALVRELAAHSSNFVDAPEILAKSAGVFVRARHMRFGASGPEVTVGEARENLGYAGGVNAWLRPLCNESGWSGVWVLNPDTAPEPGALAALVDYSKRRAKGMVGSRVMDMSQAGRLLMRGLKWRRLVSKTLCVDSDVPVSPAPVAAEVENRIDAPSGATFYITRDCIERIGVMDEEYFLYFEDIDWGVRAKACCGLGYADNSVVPHIGGTTLGSAYSGDARSRLAVYLEFRNRLMFVRKRFPSWYPWTIVITLLRSAEFLVRGPRANFAVALQGIFAGLRGETGRPDHVMQEIKSGSGTGGL